jgi:hypothetical protein
MGELRNAYNILVEQPEGKEPLGGLRGRWEYNIRMDIGEKGPKVVNWIYMAKDRGYWQDIVNMVMNLRVPQNAHNFLTS